MRRNISWRCCVKTCNCFIKTDNSKTKIVEFNRTHSHKPLLNSAAMTPGTCRGQLPSTSSPNTSIPLSATAASGVAAAVIPAPSPTPSSGPETPSILSSSTSTQLSAATAVTPTSSPTPETLPGLLEENLVLKKRVSDLQAEVKTLLDHSLE